MYAAVKGTKTIARTLQISRNTVKKYIHLHEPPQKKGIKTTLISFGEYLHTRIEQDANVTNVQLLRKIKSMGYNGGKSILNNYLKKHGKQRKGDTLLKLPAVCWTTAKVKVLLCKKDEMLKEKDKELVDDICEKSAEIQQARLLANKFRDMMDSKQGHLLRNWIAKVEQSSIQEMKGFARGLMSDYQAVVNALTLPWSNGQAEGHINKLKTIKRQIYGRASFDLLKKRVIYIPPTTTKIDAEPPSSEYTVNVIRLYTFNAHYGALKVFNFIPDLKLIHSLDMFIPVFD